MRKVIILATGGTIAGVGRRGRSLGYTSGALSAEELIAAVPEIASVAPVETVQVCNLNSDDISAEIWLDLAKRINALSRDDGVAGFVVTHGTDTLEETAYFLNLAVKTRKPVVLTGSMRPSTSISPDGPMNLYESVCVAASKNACNRGVMAVFSDRIYSARSVTKTNTYHVMAISAGQTGAIGVVRDGEVYLSDWPDKAHTCDTEFEVELLRTLPKVGICYFAVDSDPDVLRYMARRCEGIVIAGAGAGEFSRAFLEVIDSLTVPVVISSRVNDSLITQDTLMSKSAIASDSLSPQKAAVLLRLGLTVTRDIDKLRGMFRKY